MTRRDRTQVPVPDDYESHFTEDQLHAWKSLENFGMEIWFIRRPLFQDPTIVIRNHSGDVYLFDKDGKLKVEHGLTIREDSEYSTGKKHYTLVNNEGEEKRDFHQIYVEDEFDIDNIELVPLSPEK